MTQIYTTERIQEAISGGFFIENTSRLSECPLRSSTSVFSSALSSVDQTGCYPQEQSKVSPQGGKTQITRIYTHERISGSDVRRVLH